MKTREASLSHETLTRVLDYNPATGVFVWKVKRGRIKAGSQSGFLDNGGYVRIRVCGHLFMAHRLAWFYVSGTWPEYDIDHEDTDRTNNRITNLRHVTRSQNCQNQRLRTNSSTGLKGVYLHSKGQKFVAQIVSEGQHTYLGLFDTAEEAHAAYAVASSLHHGKYGRIA